MEDNDSWIHKETKGSNAMITIGAHNSALMPKGFNRKKRDQSVSWAAVFLSMIRFPDAAGNTLGRLGRWHGAARRG